jgi:hypothetical protein
MVLKSAVGANPTLLYQSLIASRHSAAVLFPTCRLADKFRLGRSLALPICPPTEVGGYEKKAR